MKEKIISFILNTIKPPRIYFVIGSILLIVLFSLAFRPDPVQVEIKKVHVGTFKKVIEEDGITRVKEKYTVYSPVNGVLRRIHKEAGDIVKEGDLLAVIDWDLKREIKSPVSGRILSIYRESSGPVEMGRPLLDIGDIKNLEVVSEILTSEVVPLSVGNEVELTEWGGVNIIGKIERIEPSAIKKVSALGVEEQRTKIIIKFPVPDAMGEGYKVRCKITAFSKENSLLVPTGALFKEKSEWKVFAVSSGKATKKKVEITERSRDESIIQSGLTEGEEVIVYPGENVKEGVSVRGIETN